MPSFLAITHLPFQQTLSFVPGRPAYRKTLQTNDNDSLNALTLTTILTANPNLLLP